MRTAKEIALISVFTALLIGGQFVLSGISGIEIVTVLLLSFSYYFGIRRGLLVANAFSLLRCFIFGFFVNVIITQKQATYQAFFENLIIISSGYWQLIGVESSIFLHYSYTAVAALFYCIFSISSWSQLNSLLVQVFSVMSVIL